MHRFFAENIDAAQGRAWLGGEDVKHMARVLRLGIGDEVTLCDGRGMDYLARISAISREEAGFELLSSCKCPSEPLRRVTLYQGLPKAGKLELAIQKCVELGIYSIVPVAAERSVVKLSPKEFEGKRTRYQRVALEAAKQAGRGVIPEVKGLTTYYDADFSHHDLIIIAYEEERETGLKGLLRGSEAMDIALIIGPEGGLEPKEVEALRARGGVSVSLGRRILRTETAGMATLAMILYELEG